MRYEVFTKKKILELSVGQITQPDEGIEKDNKITFDPDGPFSEVIFGPSSHTRTRLVTSEDKNPEINPRFNLYGHIDLTVPVMIPGTRMKQILGCGSKELNELLDGRSALIIEKPSFSALSLTEKHDRYDYLTGKDYLRYLKTIVPPKRALEDLEWGERVYNNGKGYAICRLEGIRNKSLKLTHFILPASYGLAFILAHVDIKYEMQLIKTFNDMVINNDPGVSQWMERHLGIGRRKPKVVLEGLNEKMPYLRGMLVQGMEAHEYMTDVIPVIPAGFRDPLVQTLKGVKTVTARYINSYYNSIIRIANSNPPLRQYSVIGLDDAISTALGPIKKYNEFENPQYSKQDTITKYIFIKEILNEMTVKSTSAGGGKNKTTLPAILGSKKGKFRGYDIGKRVDNSMGGVITPDINLEFDQVGIPLKLLGAYYEEAKDIDARIQQTTDGHDEVTFVEPDKRNYISMKELQQKLDAIRTILIRFPSLHRFNEMGSKIAPINGDTIKIPPLRCGPYNADFDGDTMTSILLRTKAAIAEVDKLMLPSRNLLDTNGKALMKPSQDMVLGLYYATMDAENSTTIEGVFENLDDLKRAYRLGDVKIRDRVTVNMPRYDVRYESYKKWRHALDTGSKDYLSDEPVLEENMDSSTCFSYDEDTFEIKLMDRQDAVRRYEVPTWQDNEVGETKEITSTVGRFLVNEFIPQDLGRVDRSKDKFSLEIDKPMNGSIITGILTQAIKQHGEWAIDLSQELMKTGFRNATLAGISLSILDIYPSPAVNEVLQNRNMEIKLAEQSNNKDKKIQTWASVTKEIEDTVVSKLDWNNPLSIMVKSGSRGNKNQVMQLTGMKGLIAKTDGTVVEHVVSQSLIEGLSPINYFQASFGGRKGMIDRSLTTSKTGDIERHLIYGLSDIVVTRGDCGDNEGMIVKDKLFNAKIPLNVNLSMWDEVVQDFTPATPLFLKDRQELRLKTPDNKEYYGVALSASDAINEIRFGKVVDIDGEPFTNTENETCIDIFKKINTYFIIEDKGENLIIVLKEYGNKIISREEALVGRELAREEIIDGKVYKRNHKITKEDIPTLNKLREIRVRSVISCKEVNKNKVCARCYGEFPVEQRYSAVGDAVGVIAAHTLGERTTQLTLRTFHTGGVATGDDVTQGLPEFEKFIKSKKYKDYSIGPQLAFKDKPEEQGLVPLEEMIRRGRQSLVEFKEYTLNRIETLKKEGLEGEEILSNILTGDLLTLNGEPLTWQHIGIIDTENRHSAMDSIYTFLEGVYVTSDIKINRVHYEVTVKSMLSHSFVIDVGDSRFAVGEIVSNSEILSTNIRLIAQNKKPMMAVTQVSSMRDLGSKDPATAMSFQFITRNMEASVAEAREDNLLSPLSAMVSNKRIPVGENGFKEVKEKLLQFPKSPSFEEILSGTQEKLVFGDSQLEDRIQEIEVIEETPIESNTEKLMFGEPDNILPEEVEIKIEELDTEIEEIEVVAQETPADNADVSEPLTW